MKWCKELIWLCCTILLVTAAAGQETLSKVKIYPPVDGFQRAQLLGDLEVDHFFEYEGGIITEITQKAVKKLSEKKVKHEVLIPDVAKDLAARNKKFFERRAKGNDPSKARVALEQSGSTLDAIISTPAAFQVKSTFGGYYSFPEMEAAMDALVNEYRNIASKTSIGKTAEGRDIWVIKISDNVASDEANEPELLYMGLQHAREAITGASMIFFMQYLCENYAKDARIKALVDNRVFFIIPCFNPDGWEYNRRITPDGGGGWRKNRNKVDSTRSNRNSPYTYTYGVDLNRNWGVDWANCSAPIQGPSSSCGSATKSNDTYWGSSAFSEHETQAVREFTKSRRIVAAFDQHAFGPYYSLPFGRQALHTLTEKGKNFFTAIPALMGAYNGMRAADSYDALGYEVAGGFKDWMLIGELGSTSGTGKKDTVWAMTGEGGAGGGTGGSYGSFWAPADQIVNLSKGMCYQNLQLAYAAGTYVDVQDANDIALMHTTGTLKVRVKRLGLGNDPVTITMVPLENVQSTGGSSFTIPNMAYYDEIVHGLSYKLSNNIQIGQRVRYVWQVSTTGYTYSDTVVKFYKPDVLFSDDMEGTSVATKWIVSSNVSSRWSYAMGNAYSGSQSFTESPGTNVNYTAGTTRTATYNGTLDLRGATAAYLTFWTKYRAENFRDRLEVQVSTDGSTWSPIAGCNTKQEPGTLDGSTLNGRPALTGIRDYWTQEVYDLSAYSNQSALRFQLVFKSDAASSTFKYREDDGFYIDDLSVIKSMAPIVTPLPVEFISVSANLLNKNTVAVKWEAIADLQHDHFEVERSENGTHFINLGRAGNLPPYQFIDKAPKIGTNFYRVKQVDKDGKATYSKVVSVLVDHAVELALSPNPVKDKVTLRILSREPQMYTLHISDAQGQVVNTQKMFVHAAQNVIISSYSWKAQVYIVKVINGKNEVVSTQKLVKL